MRAKTSQHTLIDIEGGALLALAFGIGVFFVVRSHMPQSEFHVISSIPAVVMSPTPTVTPEPTTNSYSQVSPDGTKEVRIQDTKNSDGTHIVTVSTADGSGNNPVTIFTKHLTAADSLQIPFNTWSPDNTYFFLTEHTQAGEQVMVFKASGESFEDSQPYLDLTSTFGQRVTGSTFQEATGWASPTLVIVNTTAQDGSKGPSYWYEVPDQAIIALSTQF